ncbi:hypothetical protein [Janthinobacterium fluminis]|uniref:Uncharacterized protein n=1 Tax=Janthinobacterium fluminis TaxID=2987524 RepID=A0ABT5JZK2_9BURK|nr:hypothetical protein [Janthinobacterium fluminis]MDC8758163.1 hypothetical protein [Janthinobacterium fluminis]
MLHTDAYSMAAQAEASGYDALVSEVSNGASLLCANEVPAPQDGKAIAQ